MTVPALTLAILVCSSIALWWPDQVHSSGTSTSAKLREQAVAGREEGNGEYLNRHTDCLALKIQGFKGRTAPRIEACIG